MASFFSSPGEKAFFPESPFPSNDWHFSPPASMLQDYDIPIASQPECNNNFQDHLITMDQNSETIVSDLSEGNLDMTSVENKVASILENFNYLVALPNELPIGNPLSLMASVASPLFVPTGTDESKRLLLPYSSCDDKNDIEEDKVYSDGEASSSRSDLGIPVAMSLFVDKAEYEDDSNGDLDKNSISSNDENLDNQFDFSNLPDDEKHIIETLFRKQGDMTRNTPYFSEYLRENVIESPNHDLASIITYHLSIPVPGFSTKKAKQKFVLDRFNAARAVDFRALLSHLIRLELPYSASATPMSKDELYMQLAYACEQLQHESSIADVGYFGTMNFFTDKIPLHVSLETLLVKKCFNKLFDIIVHIHNDMEIKRAMRMYQSYHGNSENTRFLCRAALLRTVSTEMCLIISQLLDQLVLTLEFSTIVNDYFTVIKKVTDKKRIHPSLSGLLPQNIKIDSLVAAFKCIGNVNKRGFAEVVSNILGIFCLAPALEYFPGSLIGKKNNNKLAMELWNRSVIYYQDKKNIEEVHAQYCLIMSLVSLRNFSTFRSYKPNNEEVVRKRKRADDDEEEEEEDDNWN